MPKQSRNNLNTGWHWIKFKERRVLQFEPLQAKGFNHGFLTKEWTGEIPSELIKALCPGFRAYQTKQIHSNKVIEISQLLENPETKTDGLASNQKETSLWIYSADCIPVLFADLNRGNVAAVHCGWKGITNLILLNSIKKLESMGTKKEDLIVILGPAISRLNYQVEYKLAEEIYSSIFRSCHDIATETRFKINRLSELKTISHDKDPKKLRLDIRNAAKLQLINSDLRSQQIQACTICTYSNKKLFHSWRRDKSKKSQWSYISSPDSKYFKSQYG